MVLTAQREQFCQHFAVNRDRVGAVSFAYNYYPGALAATRQQHASRLLALPEIQERLKELVAAATPALTAVERIAQLRAQCMTIINLDVAKVGTRVGNCRWCWGEGHAYQWREREYLEQLTAAERAKLPLPEYQGGFGFRQFAAPNPECPECAGAGREYDVPVDTSKFTAEQRFCFLGVKRTKDGRQLLWRDRDKASDMVARMDAAYKDHAGLGKELGHGVALALGAVAAAKAITDPHQAEQLYRDFLEGKLTDPAP